MTCITYSNNYTFNYSSNGRKFHRDNIPSLSHDKKPLGIELFHRTLFPVAEMSTPKSVKKCRYYEMIYLKKRRP